jgi:hypothetical protein
MESPLLHLLINLEGKILNQAGLLKSYAKNRSMEGLLPITKALYEAEMVWSSSNPSSKNPDHLVEKPYTISLGKAGMNTIAIA